MDAYSLFLIFGFLTPLFPFLSAFIVGFYHPFLSLRVVEYVSLGLLSLTVAGSFYVFYHINVMGYFWRCGLLLEYPFSWVAAGYFDVRWSVFYDSLSGVMLVVVSTISLLVHLYSFSYMATDPQQPRFLAYLGLFTAFMLVLVSAGNLLQLFIGWEGVGLCSYLLIGFWSSRLQANKAAIKALVLNKIGDCALLFSFGLIVYSAQTLCIPEVILYLPWQATAGVEITVGGTHFLGVEVICLTLFLGAMAKSAQLGLHTWLPDAMEGPTPVSALIHAATMVTAGVFLVLRCAPLFESAPQTLMFVAFIGGLTALFGASVAAVQYDIKKVIAYSTCSQLGYMVFACGLANYSGALFHLSTHAFFKSLLFLGAGSVIHACADEQDLRRMGGLRHNLPFSCMIMWIGSLALAGFPFLSGFYSKDLIIEAAWAVPYGAWGSTFAYTLGLGVALLTGCYSFRLLYYTFYGAASGACRVRGGARRLRAAPAAHEGDWAMGVALVILALGSIFVGAGSVRYFEDLAYTLIASVDSIVFLFSHFVSPSEGYVAAHGQVLGVATYLHTLLPRYTRVVIGSWGLLVCLLGYGLLYSYGAARGGGKRVKGAGKAGWWPSRLIEPTVESATRGGCAQVLESWGAVLTWLLAVLGVGLICTLFNYMKT
jgi:NADH-quinone oxidoreductase subunit L